MRIKIILVAIVVISFSDSNAQSKIGIIGLDTSHAIAFTRFLNNENEVFKDFRIVAAYPYGSKTIKSSYERIPGYIEQVVEMGVEIVPSVAALIEKVDYIMLLTNDGNLHLEQAHKVFKAGKAIFIDKPIGANLAQAIAIFELAQKYEVPVFSSSSLRYIEIANELRNGSHGEVFGIDCFAPARLEQTHSDLAWYGIHGVEMMFTVMGTGCVSVNRMSSGGTDVVAGLWGDGRIATVRGTRTGKSSYGGNAFTSNGVISLGPYKGYESLLVEILKFFKTKITPVPANETLEIFTFIEAADESKKSNGQIVLMTDVYTKAQKEASLLLRALK